LLGERERKGTQQTLQYILRIVTPLGSEITFTSLIGLSEYLQRTTVTGMSIAR